MTTTSGSHIPRVNRDIRVDSHVPREIGDKQPYSAGKQGYLTVFGGYIYIYIYIYIYTNVPVWMPSEVKPDALLHETEVCMYVCMYVCINVPVWVALDAE